MPPTVLKQANGSFIVKEELTDEVDYLANLRRYELRLRDMKATRTGSVKYKSAAQNKRAVKVARIKAKQDREAREKQQENLIRNLLASGKQPLEIRQLFASLEEVDKNAAMWKYIDSHVKRDTT